MTAHWKQTNEDALRAFLLEACSARCVFHVIVGTGSKG